jgi:photosystem II stability/assembly factor-like uncharacterized protein
MPTLDAQTLTNPFENYYDAQEWRSIGPYRGGRSCAVTGVPGNPLLYYFGSTGGGVWKTNDGGQSWKNISDGYFGGSIGSVAVSESDPNVIYVGGGEKTVRGNVSYGYGVWKSVDGGKSWMHIGLKDSRHIPRIRIHPRNPDIAYAAVLGDLYKPSDERGVYKTINGGETWTKVLFANSDAGAVDLIFNPGNPRILYATTWNIRRSPYSLSSGGPGSSLWKSTDDGNTWQELKGNKGLPTGTWGISAIAVSPINTDRLWAIIENEKGGVYRSDDGGESWTKTNDERKLRQRAWYYTRIYADTKDVDMVYVMNVRYHRSKDGGKTFDSYVAPHGDHHDLWISPEDNSRMIIGDDGGAQISFDRGENWSTYRNQPTAQFYRVTTDNHFPFRIYAAQQDNSTIRILHRSDQRAITNAHWERSAGGESAHIAVDPEDNDIVYGGSYGGYLTRLDHKTGMERAINVWPNNPMGHGAENMKYRFQWNFPVAFSRHNPDKMYALSNHVHVTYDEGQSWEVLSPDLTRNDPDKLVASGGPITKDNTGVEYYCTLFAMAESPIEDGTFWVGSDDGLLHITTDNGKNWTNVTPPELPEWTMINCLDADPHNAGGLYVAATAYKNGDYAPYMYRTADYGKTWKKIIKGIEAEHFTRAIRVDPQMPGMLYAGTETGMYVSWNDGDQWYPLQMNLPIVPITDLTIKSDKLIAATQGRSLWMLDDLSLIRQAHKMQAEEVVHLFQPPAAFRIRGSQSQNVRIAGTNHAGGVMTNYYLDTITSADKLSLIYMSANKDTIAHFSTQAEEKKYKIEPEPGSNNFTWNMRHKNATSFDGMIMWAGSMNGPIALPGTYFVQLRYNDEVQEESFEILLNPKSEITKEELTEQVSFINEVNKTISDAHEAIIEMRKMKKQLDAIRALQKDTVLIQKMDEVTLQLDSLENLLYQTQNSSRQDPLNFPIKLTNKLAHLNSLIQIGDYPPTESMTQVKTELSSRIYDVLNTFNRIVDQDIKELNALIKERVVEFIQTSPRP